MHLDCRPSRRCLPALARPPVADGDRPVVEQIAADRDLVAAMMVQFSVVGF